MRQWKLRYFLGKLMHKKIVCKLIHRLTLNRLTESVIVLYVCTIYLFK